MIQCICALDLERGIGKDGKMPWHFPEDLQHFKALTLHHTVIMGRKTFESIGKALPDRNNIVITSQKDYQAEGCQIVHSLKDALDTAENDAFVIGGQSLFEQALPFADILYLTEIQDIFEADTFFPSFNKQDYQRTVLKKTEIPYKAEFCVYTRNKQ